MHEALHPLDSVTHFLNIITNKMSTPNSLKKPTRPFVKLPGLEITVVDNGGKICQFIAVVDRKIKKVSVVNDKILDAWLKIEKWIYEQ